MCALVSFKLMYESSEFRIFITLIVEWFQNLNKNLLKRILNLKVDISLFHQSLIQLFA